MAWLVTVMYRLVRCCQGQDAVWRQMGRRGWSRFYLNFPESASCVMCDVTTVTDRQTRVTESVTSVTTLSRLSSHLTKWTLAPGNHRIVSPTK